MTGLTVPWTDRRWRRLFAFHPRVATTPGRLRLAAVSIVLGAVAFGLVGATAAATRRDAASAAGREIEPLLIRAGRLHDVLADADATVSATFVVGGAEPTSRRKRYLADIDAATAGLAEIGRASGGSTHRAAARVIGRDLPIYTGLIETARADNRQGYPIGAAYLR